MSLFKTFETDAEKEVKGIKVPFEANDDGTIPTFLIARSGGANKRYAIEMEREAAPHRRALELKTLKNEVSEEIVRRVFIRTVLLGWENVQGKDNKTIDYSEENALQLMRILPDLYVQLQREAADIANFRQNEMEQVTKN